MEGYAKRVWKPLHLPPPIAGMGKAGSVGGHLANFPQSSGRAGQAGMEPGLSGWQLRSRQKGGEDIEYGWKGKGSTVHMMTDGHGLPLAFDVTAANVAEVTVGLDVVDRVRVPRRRGRPRKRPDALAADKGYDTEEFRRQLRMRGIRPSIPRRQRLGRQRKPRQSASLSQLGNGIWMVERTHGWMDNFRRLVVRYERQTDSYLAFLTIACLMLTLSRILG